MQTDRYQLTTAGAPATLNKVQWNELIKKIFRTLQIYVPFLHDFRFVAQRFMRRVSNTTAESDFDALRLIPGMDNGLAIDIGANRGDTIQAIKMRTHNTRVMAFEPNPLIFSRLNRIYRNRKDVKLFNFGLGNKDEIVALNVPFYKDYMFDGLASFDIAAALGWLRGRIFFYNDKYLKLRQIDCCLTRLDRFEVNPTFIKIDVQGFEDRVLGGAVETINRCRPVILIETPSAEIIRFMKRMDYQPCRYDQKRMHEGLGGLNTFFVPVEKINGILNPVSSQS
jgi:FkbM family methyltransferase